MNVTELLTTARQMIVDKGWSQGSARNDNGVCVVVSLMGAYHALRSDIHYPGMISGAYGQLATAVGVERPEIVEKIILWNDDPDRTQSDVLAMFDRAIAESTIST